jgi:hypothetical protein
VPKLASALVGLPVKKGGFKVLRRRWVIEHTFSRLRRNRRLMAHYKSLAMSALGFAKLTMIAVMLKRLMQVTPFYRGNFRFRLLDTSRANKCD